MSRVDTAPDHALLARALRDPDQLKRLSPSEFNRLIDAARDARLLGWLLWTTDRCGVPSDPPDWLSDRISHCRAMVREFERALRWEMDRLDRALHDSRIVWVLLKGAAYLAAGLPPGRGRRVADIDILVAEQDLPRAEAALAAHGWEYKALDAYDERYYREWMHELPPMVHRDRQSVVDLHHAILPRTSRLRPPSSRLLDRAEVTAEGLRVLSPSHMVLHAAAHLFHDGEIGGALRDVVDLAQLFHHFGGQPDFWDDFVNEAAALGLTRPAYYAVRYTTRWFHVNVPDRVLRPVEAWAPPTPTRRLMDALVGRAIPVDGHPARRGAVFALYVRSHWLRMPPLRLAQHLARKEWRALRGAP
jgi:hypothetical protein